MRLLRDMARRLVGLRGNKERAERLRRERQHELLDAIRDERVHRAQAAADNMQHGLETMVWSGNK